MNPGWHVMEHGSLLQLAHNLWLVDGAVPRMALRRSCTVVRRNTGGLVVHSAICLDESTQAHLEALGPVEHVVVPGAMHRLDAPRYAERCPAARVVAPASVREKVEERRRRAAERLHRRTASKGRLACAALRALPPPEPAASASVYLSSATAYWPWRKAASPSDLRRCTPS